MNGFLCPCSLESCFMFGSVAPSSVPFNAELFAAELFEMDFAEG